MTHFHRSVWASWARLKLRQAILRLGARPGYWPRGQFQFSAALGLWLSPGFRINFSVNLLSNLFTNSWPLPSLLPTIPQLLPFEDGDFDSDVRSAGCLRLQKYFLKVLFSATRKLLHSGIRVLMPIAMLE